MVVLHTKNLILLVVLFAVLCHGQYKCFDSNEELWKAIHKYLEDPASNSTNVSLTYGHPIGSWCVGRISDFSSVFSLRLESFNESLNGWDTSNATNMFSMFFLSANFNPDISRWDTSKVTNFVGMFTGAHEFNQNLSLWNTSSATDMAGMYTSAQKFNGDIRTWDTSSVQSFRATFLDTHVFNQDISPWDVSAAVDFGDMFQSSLAFNQNLSSWHVSAATNLKIMFKNASGFAQNLCAWGDRLVNQTVVVSDMFLGSNCTNQNDPRLSGFEPPGPFCEDCAPTPAPTTSPTIGPTPAGQPTSRADCSRGGIMVPFGILIASVMMICTENTLFL